MTREVITKNGSVYYCGECGASFKTQEKADLCALSHKKYRGVVDVNYKPYEESPYEVYLCLSDGRIVKYIRAE